MQLKAKGQSCVCLELGPRSQGDLTRGVTQLDSPAVPSPTVMTIPGTGILQVEGVWFGHLFNLCSKVHKLETLWGPETRNGDNLKPTSTMSPTGATTLPAQMCFSCPQ